jgi:hypothetical protein
MTGLLAVAVCLLMKHVETSEFPLDAVVTVTVGVLDRYMSSCVYLHYPTDQRSEYLNFVGKFVKPIPSVSHGTLYHYQLPFSLTVRARDRLCGLVVRVPGYRPSGPRSIPGATGFSVK